MSVITLAGMERSPASSSPPLLRAHLERRPVKDAAAWMLDVAAECARHSTFNRGIIDYLRACGLVNQCVILAADPGGPLTFRFIGIPTMIVMGRAWARQNLGRPVAQADGTDFGDAMFASYDDAADGTSPVVNRVSLNGLVRPLTYTHSLIGWRDGAGGRVILSCVQL